MTVRLNDLLLQLDKLKTENNSLIQNARKSLGAQIVAQILTVPFEGIGTLGELLQRYFGNIISNELLQAADNFMRRVWAVKKEAQYITDQLNIVLAQLEKAAKELENAKERLEECEKNKEPR